VARARHKGEVECEGAQERAGNGAVKPEGVLSLL
jgi:hypothetical protein